MVRKVLLAAGILSSVLYVSRDLAALLTYPGYDFVNQVISEQSAIDAPGRNVNVVMGLAYGALIVAFGSGMWLSAGVRRSLKIAGALLVVAAIYGAFWPPMHMRGAQTSSTDMLHIVWTAAWFALSVSAMFLSASALGKRFMYYTVATVAVILVFGLLTGLQGPNLPANLPTPGIGVYERINIGAFLLWIVALAVQLWPQQRSWRTQHA